MEPQLITAMELDNGLTLEIWDASRKVAADRWQVKLVARMEIKVAERWFAEKNQPPVEIEQLRTKLGQSRRFEYITERNFVDEREKQPVFNSMQESLKTKISYYSHPDFAARFLMKEYAAVREFPSPS